MTIPEWASEGQLAALEEELEASKRYKPGGQAPNPDRTRVIEAKIAEVRKALGHKPKAKETTVSSAPTETA